MRFEADLVEEPPKLRFKPLVSKGCRAGKTPTQAIALIAPNPVQRPHRTVKSFIQIFSKNISEKLLPLFLSDHDKRGDGDI